MGAETNQTGVTREPAVDTSKAATKDPEKAASATVKPSSPGETGTTPGTNWK